MLNEILRQLNRNHQRATYGAVGGIVDVPARWVMKDKERNRVNSWVVAKRNGLPTGYDKDNKDNKHPELLKNPHVIHDPVELRRWLNTNRQ